MIIKNVNRKFVKIIDFEGMDASYKETNSKALYEYLKKEKYADEFSKGILDIKKLEFPSYDPRRSYFVSEFLHGKYKDSFDIDFILKYDKKGNFARYLLENQLTLLCSVFFLEMFDWNATLVLDKPTIIVLDRYYYSQMYYLTKNIHKVFGDDTDELFKFVSKVSSIALSTYLLPEANCIIKMSNTFDNMIKTIKERKQTDIYEEDYEYLKSVHNLFTSKDNDVMSCCTTSLENTMVKSIDVSDKDRETVFSEVKNAVEPILNTFDELLVEYKQKLEE